MCTPPPTTPPTPDQADPVAVLYMRQRAAELTLWGPEHAATVKAWADLTDVQQEGWRKTYALDQAARAARAKREVSHPCH